MLVVTISSKASNVGTARETGDVLPNVRKSLLCAVILLPLPLTNTLQPLDDHQPA